MICPQSLTPQWALFPVTTVVGLTGMICSFQSSSAVLCALNCTATNSRWSAYDPYLCRVLSAPTTLARGDEFAMNSWLTSENSVKRSAQNFPSTHLEAAPIGGQP